MNVLYVKSARVLICAVAAAIWANPVLSAVSETDWQPQLDPPAEPAGRTSDEVFVIRLSSAYDATSGRLALELDNVDVTQHVRPRDESYTVFEFVPYTPLPGGTHLLRMVEYRTDGSIVERGRWEFSVREVQSAFDARVGMAASYRVDEKPAALTQANRSQAHGSMSIDAYTEDHLRRYAATGDLLLATNTAAAVGGGHRAVDLGDFLVTRDTQRTRVAAGHHFPGAARGMGQRNLIFDGMPRRGLSGTVQSDDARTALTGFALRTETIRGFEHGLGVGDVDNRIAGGMLRLQPESNIAVAFGYVSGEGSDAGFATGGESAPLKGNAASAAADSLWFENRLSLRGEAAFSSVDLGQAFGEVTDQAYVAELVLQPHRGLKVGERYIPWSLGLNYARIGSGFRSIGNLQQVANIEELRAGFNTYLGTVNVNLTGARVEDNVDAADPWPTTRSDNVNVALNWSPAVDADFGGWLFARPSVGLNLLGDWRETVHQPAASQALPIDTGTRGYTTWASFGHPYGNWTVTWGETSAEDRTDAAPDYRYESTGLFSNFQFGERFSITPGVQYDVARDRSNDVRQRATNVTLSQNWAVLVDRLYWNVSLGFNSSRTSDNSSDLQQFVSNTTLSWRHGLFSLWLQGSYTDIDNEVLDMFSGTTSLFAQEQYQLFLGVSMNWPGGNGAMPAVAATGPGGVQ